MSNKPKPKDCQFNEGVACTSPGKCASCGWNEKVAAARAIRILAQFGYVIKK
jgi:hypothetical protein